MTPLSSLGKALMRLVSFDRRVNENAERLEAVTRRVDALTDIVVAQREEIRRLSDLLDHERRLHASEHDNLVLRMENLLLKTDRQLPRPSPTE